MTPAKRPGTHRDLFEDMLEPRPAGAEQPATVAAPPKATKRERTRARLIAAARQVFARQGYLNTKITDITAEAGVANGLFYSYFEDKNDLLRALTAEFKAQLPHVLTTKWKRRPHPLVGIAVGTEMFVRDYLEHQADVAGIFQAAIVDKSFAALWQEIRSHGVRLAASYVRQAQKLGFATGLDPELAASALCSMIEFSCYNWNSLRLDFPERAVGEEELILTLVTLVLSCLGRGRACAEADAYLETLRARLAHANPPRTGMRGKGR